MTVVKGKLRKLLKVNFIVKESHSTYNVLLGRPLLRNLKALISVRERLSRLGSKREHENVPLGNKEMTRNRGNDIQRADRRGISDKKSHSVGNLWRLLA